MWKKCSTCESRFNALASIGRNCRAGLRVTAGLLVGATLVVASSGPGADDAMAQQRLGERATPDYHVVAEGDTMWDVSGSYFGDNFQWPRLWSFNPHITNPHWVYPGDILYLKQGQPGATAQQAQEATGRAPAQTREETAPFGMHLPLAAFITTDELPYVGRIIGSPKEANLLAEHDTVWVGFGENGYTAQERDESDERDRAQLQDTEPQVGDLYAIVRRLDEVRDENGGAVGHKYVVLGSLQITQVSDRHANTAEIRQSWQEIERGDLLVAYERQLKVVQPVQADQDVVARIVDVVQPGFNFAEHHYVFINRGAEHGVRVGNRFFIYQRFEGLDRPGKEAGDEFPWQRVGQILVLDVREQFATAVITDSSREIQIGDRLEMYQGY